MMRNRIALFIVVLLFGFRAEAATEPGSFEHANQLYEEGRYLDAIQAYSDLSTNQPTLAVCFNLGNAYFKSGQLGEAIAEYRRAAAIAPRDPDVRANLGFARAQVSGPSYQSDWKERMAEKLTDHEWVLLSCGVTWIFFLLLAARQFRPTWASTLLPWTVLSAALGILLTCSCVWVAHARTATQIAVVSQREAVMRLGPFEESKSMANLPDGAELKVLDYKNNWLQVTPDGKSIGWITNDSARVIH